MKTNPCLVQGSTALSLQSKATERFYDLRALIVDDDLTSNQLLQLMLKRMNFEVRGIVNGFDLFDELETYRPDVLFLDVYLPGMNGLDLLTEMHQHPAFQTIFTVIVTAVDTPSDREEARRAGSSSFLSKPFRREDLETLLEVL